METLNLDRLLLARGVMNSFSPVPSIYIYCVTSQIVQRGQEFLFQRSSRGVIHLTRCMQIPEMYTGLIPTLQWSIPDLVTPDCVTSFQNSLVHTIMNVLVHKYLYILSLHSLFSVQLSHVLLQRITPAY